MTKKICFVSTFAYPLFNPDCKVTFGGSEVQMYLLAKELAKDKNFDVKFIVADFGQKKIENYEGVEIYKSYSIRKKIVNYIKAPIILYKTLKKINPDVVIQRSAAPETGICAFFCKLNKKKFVYSIASTVDINGEFAKKGILGKLYNYGLDNVDYIIAQNKDQKNLLEQWKKKEFQNIEVIKSGYEMKFKIKSNAKKFILWIGRSDKCKNPDLFIDLAEKFPAEKFVMIMPKSKKEIWEKIYKRIKNTKNIEFLERIPFHKIDNYFKKAKIFLNTSKYEGFPNTFVQACKNGTPIVSLNVNPDNFLEKYKCGFFCKNDVNLMKDQINILLKNKKIYQEKSRNIFNYAKENHNIKNNIKIWKKIMKNLTKIAKF